MTLTVTVNRNGGSIGIEVVIMPSFLFPLGSPYTASRLMVVSGYYGNFTTGLKLPINTAAGQYIIGLGTCTSLTVENGQVICGDYSVPWKAVTITVTG